MKKARHPTLSDVARYAGVGTTTVSRVINGGERVRPDTNASVRRAIKELGFIPNPAARALKGEQSKTIGLILPSIADPFFANCAEAIEQVARNLDFLLIVTVTHNEIDRELQTLNALLRRVDGLLLAPARSDNPPLVALLKRISIPVICFDRPLNDMEIPTVLIDNYRFAKLATQHLIGHKRQRILCLGGEALFHTVRERQRGYLAAMQEADYLPIIEVSEHLRGKGEVAKVLRKHFDSKHAPQAVFSLNNRITIEANDYLQRSGLLIPDQVALIGFDDFTLAATLRPSITVVRQPAEEIGRTAATLLFERLSGEKDSFAEVQKGLTILLESHFITRASCGCSPVPEPPSSAY